MEKKKTSQPMLSDDQRESSNREMNHQSSGKMPGGNKHSKQKSKKGDDMKNAKEPDDKQW